MAIPDYQTIMLPLLKFTADVENRGHSILLMSSTFFQKNNINNIN